MDVVTVAVWAFMWTLAGVQTLVQLKVDKLCEFSWAEFTVIGFLP